MWCPLLIARNVAGYFAKTWRASARERYVCPASEKRRFTSSDKRFIPAHAPASVDCLFIAALQPLAMKSPTQLHRHSKPIV
jgi:hypothetical protein